MKYRVFYKGMKSGGAVYSNQLDLTCHFCNCNKKLMPNYCVLHDKFYIYNFILHNFCVFFPFFFS